MFNSISTYRIQFHKEFSFKDFKIIIPYLHQLGISTIYASPIFEAIPGSTHGYDCTNPLAINPEIGTLDELRDISRQLKERNICWIQDIVPNHMSYHPNNKWLMDVLENGEVSEYASYFDIRWNATGNQKLMTPFLSRSLEDAANDGDLKLYNDNGKWMFDSSGSHYPISKESIENVLANTIDENLPTEKLIELAKAQHYRLCHWQETDSRINYRRFFTVNSLICLNIQHENVFTHHHSFIKQLIDEGIFQGLRIDHIDGLHNPTQYLERLRKLGGDNVYIVAEKILEPGESLPSHWPLNGSTGYDFLSLVNNLFINKKNRTEFTEFYQQLTGNYSSIGQQMNDKKSHILQHYMSGELNNLYELFLQLQLINKKDLSRIPSEDLKAAIGEFLVQCPVYRFYGTSFPLNKTEENEIAIVLRNVRRNGESTAAVSLLEYVFLEAPYQQDQELNDRITKFYKRCMQFAGPLMAKGVEDTLMYTNNRFAGHNEVGDSPGTFGIGITEFHRLMRDRQQHWPLSMSSTATHDTKRGEDVRARLNVLTDLSEQWITNVNEWIRLNSEIKKHNAPDANDEYLIYQALIGHYPIADDDDFENRIQSYLEKALREAKTHSNWAAPNEEYEAATKEFVVQLLHKQTPFWKSFIGFLQQVHEHSMINSLSQVLLKFTLPGIPDIYQGCELWDFSFVDPDNRRAVDYSRRQKILQSFDDAGEDLLPSLWKETSGAIKLWLTQKMLTIRKADKELFTEGDYIPLSVEGKYKDYVYAFARKLADKTYLFALPLHTAALCTEHNNFFKIDWQDTRIVLPKEFGGFSDVLSGQSIAKTDGLFAKNLFRKFTVAILKGTQSTKERGAGILLHITSLPSHFGVGDLGPGAKTFADFLHHGGQSYWQLLPLNPTEEGQHYSPYSALSSKAGWPLLISPENLAKDGWLNADELHHYHLPGEALVDYCSAEKNKNELLEKAFENFNATANDEARQDFFLFCEKEKAWLNDFAVFTILKKQHEGQPWYEWPDEQKKRDVQTLHDVQANNSKPIEMAKWLQYIFTKQYTDLRTYCNNRNIKLIGDIPFYVSYDSADVWSAQELFSLNENGERIGMAGVPPDAFSDDGQLWGMPTFNWQRIKQDGYSWWIQRLRKNIEMFDITRLDHFRAFEAYWQVPAGEQTAKKGKWVAGPKSDFFKAMQKEFGELPFIAEDLGDINAAVLNLRDKAHLPGMKILQFAFGENMPQNAYAPHNYEKNFWVYTGTHDNNTTVGWWRMDANDTIKKQLEVYTGQAVHEGNIHAVMVRLAYASVANTAIIPMQDIFGLNESARMNKPSSVENNWAWRLLPHQISGDVERTLLEWVELYNR